MVIFFDADDPSLIHSKISIVDFRIGEADLVVLLRFWIKNIDSFGLEIGEDDPAIGSDKKGCSAIFVDLTECAEFLRQDIPHVSPVIFDYGSPSFFMWPDFQEIDLLGSLVYLDLVKSNRASSEGGRCDGTLPSSVGSSF
jgi:hypothetical protein